MIVILRHTHQDCNGLKQTEGQAAQATYCSAAEGESHGKDQLQRQVCVPVEVRPGDPWKRRGKEANRRDESLMQGKGLQVKNVHWLLSRQWELAA